MAWSDTCSVRLLHRLLVPYIVMGMMAAVLSACSQLPTLASAPQPTDAPSAATVLRTQQLQPVTAFALEAKLAVQYAGKGYTARLTWSHTSTKDMMYIFSPLGQQVAVIERTPDGVQLTDQQGKHHQAADIGQLTEQLLGWRLPLAGLSVWVLGLADADRPFDARYQADGTLQQLAQDGWTIDYISYQTATVQVDHSNATLPVQLPQQLSLQQNDLRLKLVIKDWHSVQPSLE